MKADGASRWAREPKAAALDVLELAHRVSLGEVRLPAAGVGPRNIDGRIVVPAAVHVVVCGWTVASAWEPVDGQPAVKECHGCGLLRLMDEAAGAEAAAEVPSPVALRVAGGRRRAQC